MNEIVDYIFSDPGFTSEKHFDKRMYFYNYIYGNREYLIDFYYLRGVSGWVLSVNHNLKGKIKVNDLQSLICRDPGYSYQLIVKFEHPNSIEDCKKFVERWIEIMKSGFSPKIMFCDLTKK